MPVPPVTFEVKGRTAWIRIDRPQVRNALDLETVAELRQAAARVSADDDVDQAVLTGEGPVFSAGGDINAMLERRGKGAATFERHMEGLADLVRTITENDKVWIARVGGDAVGAGLGLVLACDLAVASDAAKFAAVFGRMGLVADTGVSALLTRAIGPRRTAELLLTARFLSATEAATFGIVQRVVPTAELDDSVADVVRTLGEIPVATRARLKRQLRRNAEVPVRDALSHEAMLQGLAFATPEHAQRVDAFLSAKANKGGDRGG